MLEKPARLLTTLEKMMAMREIRALRMLEVRTMRFAGSY